MFAHHFFSLVVISLLVSQPRKTIARLTLPKSTGACLRLRDIELSPDGSKAVMLIAKGNTYHVVLLDIAKSKTKLLMAANPEEFTYNWCQFANNTRIVCSMGSFIELKAGQIGIGRRYYEDGRTVATRLIAVDIDGKNVLQLVKPKTGQSGTGRLVWNPRIQDNVVSWMRDDKKNILIHSWHVKTACIPLFTS